MALLDLPGHVFVVPGDLTQLRADVVVYSTSTALLGGGHLYGPFVARFPWFAEALARAIPEARPGEVGCAVGHAFALEPPDGRGPAVVVVASTIDRGFGTTTRERLSRDDCADRAVRGALAVAHEYLRKLPGGLRRLVALPALRMGLGGDRNDRLRSARTQVRAALDCLKGMPGVDVAFVPFTPDTHQVFLQARRDVVGGPPPCPLPEGGRSERLARLVRAVRAGRCVLFVGSGLSWQLPGWAGLLNALAADLGRPPLTTFDLKAALDLAEDYLWERGGGRLAAEIRRRYADYDRLRIKPTAPHYLLLALPLRLVITTNYDDLLERTLTALRRHHRLVLRDHDVVHTGAPDPLCVVKFHGDPVADGGRGIVLARGQYEAFRVQHPGLALLLAGSLLNQTFLFIGYSRVDPNFQEIFEEVASLYEGAGWQAFATAVDAPGPAPSGGGHLELLQMPGEDEGTRIHRLALFLDWLADAVLLGPHDLPSADQPGAAEDLPAGLFLAPDVLVEGTGPVHALRRGLLEQVAKVVEASCDGALRPDLGAKEARHLARMLRFLVEQGWRPSERAFQTAAMRLARFWERLAECVGDPVERARCLAAAWRFAERHDDIQRLGKLLGHP
jgi:O-acetyl-ADP-ribose deacetylase (regulator of RNase III)